MKTTRNIKRTKTIGLKVGDTILESNREVEIVSIVRKEHPGRCQLFRVELSNGRGTTAAWDAHWAKVVS